MLDMSVRCVYPFLTGANVLITIRSLSSSLAENAQQGASPLLVKGRSRQNSIVHRLPWTTKQQQRVLLAPVKGPARATSSCWVFSITNHAIMPCKFRKGGAEVAARSRDLFSFLHVVVVILRLVLQVITFFSFVLTVVTSCHPCENAQALSSSLRPQHIPQ